MQSVTSPSAIASTGKNNETLKVVVALLVVYIIWGSTYLGIHVGLQSFPPLTLSYTRFWLSGGFMLALAFMRGERLPDLRLSLNAVLIGCLTLAAGTGSVSIAEQWVSSGLTALAVAAVPLWVAIFAAMMIKRPTKVEWIGLIVGFAGIVLLNMEKSFQSEPLGAIVLILGPLSWSFGSILSKRIAMPQGLMALAIEMLGAAALLSILAAFAGEQMPSAPTFNAILAVIYLATFGSVIGFSAYMWLLENVRPALATSYAYVNPVVAVLLGVLFVGETISLQGIISMGVILTGVVVVVLARSK